MSILWTWQSLCECLNLPVSKGPDIDGIDFDSRTIKSNELFVALPGDPGNRFNSAERTVRDGHGYVEDAFKNGAVAALVHREIDVNIPQLLVDNTLDALWSIARYRRREINAPVVAVTGSSGKTTLKAFLTNALQAHSSAGSFNNYLGVPISLARTPANTKLAVYEIGTNHEGEIAPLSKLVSPDVAVVLNVLPVHIGHFPSMDALRKEKLSISEGLSSNGILVIPSDLDYSELHPQLSVVTFGLPRHADVGMQMITDHKILIESRTARLEVNVPGGGMHRASTLNAAAAVLYALDLPIDPLKHIPNSLPRGRGNLHVINDITVIDESYNANPVSMSAALKQLATRSTSHRKIALLGDMKELGDDTKRYHQQLRLSLEGIDAIICVGEAMCFLNELVPEQKRWISFNRADESLLAYCIEQLQPGDAILVKGSHGIFWQANFVDQLVTNLRQLKGVDKDHSSTTN